MVLNDKIDQLNLIDMSRTLQPKPAADTFFSSANGIFSKTELFDQKTSLKKL